MVWGALLSILIVLLATVLAFLIIELGGSDVFAAIVAFLVVITYGIVVNSYLDYENERALCKYMNGELVVDTLALDPQGKILDIDFKCK